jgi:hypothetical protein
MEVWFAVTQLVLFSCDMIVVLTFCVCVRACVAFFFGHFIQVMVLLDIQLSISSLIKSKVLNQRLVSIVVCAMSPSTVISDLA